MVAGNRLNQFWKWFTTSDIDIIIIDKALSPHLYSVEDHVPLQEN